MNVGGGTVAPDLNAAATAPQLSDAPSEALAEIFFGFRVIAAALKRRAEPVIKQVREAGWLVGFRDHFRFGVMFNGLGVVPGAGVSGCR